MSEQQKWAVMCSMTGGWGVARPEHAYREDDGLLACTDWESLHDTWTEAMQEADRMARTVAVGLAHEWAQTAINTLNNFPKGHAAAEVIQSLPGEWIDADKLREVIEEARFLIRDGEPEIILNDLIALLAHAQKDRN